MFAEFVQLVSSEAAEISMEDKKKTILPEHIIRALQKLGFDHYVPEATTAWNQLKDDAKGGKFPICLAAANSACISSR